jgi:hypothetical protein
MERFNALGNGSLACTALMTTPARRRFRWSLRTMFVVVTGAGILFACLLAFPGPTILIAFSVASVAALAWVADLPNHLP